MLAIAPLDHPALRNVAHPVSVFDLSLRELADGMNAVRAEYGGVGIAAPQVGVSLRLFVIDDRLPDGSKSDRYGDRRIEPMVVVNPEVAWRSDEVEDGEEGCLSLPSTLGADGERRLVPRPTAIEYRARNLDGASIGGRLEGFMARVFLHELDHLDGLLIDRYPVATRNTGSA